MTRTRNALAVAGFLACSAAACAQWNVTVLHPGSNPRSEAYAIHGDTIVGFAAEPVTNMFHGFAWYGPFHSLADLTPVLPPNIQTQGEVFDTFGNQHVGYSWRESGPDSQVYMATLFGEDGTNLHPVGATWSAAYGIHAGQQVGAATFNGVTQAGYWRNSRFSWTSLHPVGATESRALAVQGGQQAGFAAVNDENHASLWSGSAGSWLDLNPVGASDSVVYAMDSGQLVGTAFIGGVQRAGLWTGTAASWVSLHPAGAQWSFASGVYEGQQVGAVTIGGVQHAALWTGSVASLIDLHDYLPGEYSESQALDVWRDGQPRTFVVGSGFNQATGRVEALLWTSDPGIPNGCDPDVNCDGSVNGFDVEAMEQAVNGDLSNFCQPDPDFNRDGSVNGFDIEAVEQTVNGAPC